MQFFWHEVDFSSVMCLRRGGLRMHLLSAADKQADHVTFLNKEEVKKVSICLSRDFTQLSGDCEQLQTRSLRLLSVALIQSWN